MKWNKKDPYWKGGVTFVISGIALMLAYYLLNSVDDLWSSFIGRVQSFLSVMAPFLIAIVFAYVLKPIRDFLTKVLKKLLPKVRIGVIRAISLTVAVLAFLALMGTLVGFLLPALWKNVVDMLYQLPVYFEQAKKGLQTLQTQVPWLEQLNINMDTIEAQIVAWLENFVNTSNWGAITGQVVATVGNIFSGLFNFVLSIVLCIYILKSGRNLAKGMKDTMVRQMGKERADSLISLFQQIDAVFGQYIGGKMIQSLIMFLMILPLFLLLGVTYAPLMAVIVALTNLIPYIGPFIGGAVPVFFMLLINPVKALLVLGAVLLVQQIDNYLVEPRLIGDRMGIHPFWVIACVLIGGHLFGLFGILLAIPLASVIRILAIRYFERRDRRRTAKGEPSSENDNDASGDGE